MQEIAQKLNLNNVEIVTDASTLSGKRAKAKGYFNPTTGKIVIVIPNHASVLDVEETVLHEAVAHYGLRKLFGKHFDTFLDNVYESADPEIRKKIAALATKNGWEQPWEECRHYDIIINRYKQEDWDSEASERLVEYIIEKYGVERFLSSKFGGDEIISKLVTAIKNQLVYGKEEPTEHDILRRSRNVTGPQATDGRTNQNGATDSGLGQGNSNQRGKGRTGEGVSEVKSKTRRANEIAERFGEGAVSDEGVTMASDPVSKAIGEPRYGLINKRKRMYLNFFRNILLL